MALVVEDGTGKVDAESYVSVADAGAYAASHGLTFNVTGDPAIALAEKALRRATTWLDGQYRSQFLGYRRFGRNQRLEWPRSGAYVQAVPYGTIAQDEVPHEVVEATVEAAVRELAVPGALSPDVTPGRIQKSVRVEGAVAVEYSIGTGGAYDQRPVLTVVSGILAPVLGNDSSGGLFGKASRS